MSIDISLTIEEIVKEKHISYIEAILEYTNEIDGEIEGVAKMINKSIKDKIEAEAKYEGYIKRQNQEIKKLEAEAEELNMFKKSSKLPI